MIVLLPVLCVGLVSSAATAAPAHPFVGTYSISIKWTNPVINFNGTMTVSSDHVATLSNGEVLNWTSHHKKFTMVAGSSTFSGKKTKTGITGTMTNGEGNSGTWSAVFE
jgi:hypothetical protein